MTYKVIQWGAGLNGTALIRAIHRHAELELVGCLVYSDAKDGVDAGTLAGIEPVGIKATTDQQRIAAMDADVVIHCPSLNFGLRSNDSSVLELLRSGKNVISVTGAHSFPAAYPGYAEQFEQACKEGGSTFTHTGINPGFIGERLVPTLSGICTDIESIRFREIYDCSEDSTEIIEFMQFGVAMDAWTKESPVGKTFEEIFFQVLCNMAHTFNFDLSGMKTTANVVPAHRTIELAGTTGSPIIIKKGTVAGIHLIWEGVAKDDHAFRLIKENIWAVSEDLPGFTVHRGWDIQIEGKPCLDLKLNLTPSESGELYEPECMVGAAIPVIPEVTAAEPGILLPNIFAPFKKHF